jgi:hypothetical protein
MERQAVAALAIKEDAPFETIPDMRSYLWMLA